MTFKSGFISLIGRPNVGKSSLLNHLIGAKVSIVTNKAQTTRHNVQGVLTLPQHYQLIFIDTPGIHQSHKLIDQQMNSLIFKGMKASDLVLLVVPANEKVEKNDLYLMEDVRKKELPFVVVLSKKDLITPEELNAKVQEWAMVTANQELIFPLSIYDSLSLEKLTKKILKLLPTNDHQYFEENISTTLSPKQRIQDLIRERVLFKTGQEIPHNVLVLVNSIENLNSDLNIDASIIVERPSQKGIVIGKAGQKIKDIKYQVRKELKKIYPNHQVNLVLTVKVKKNWRNSPNLVKKELSDKEDF